MKPLPTPPNAFCFSVASFMIVSTLLLSCAGERLMDGGGPAAIAAELLQVPDGFVVERATPPGMVSYPMFATFDNQGRLFVIESSGKTTSTEDVLKNPTFQILLLEDVNGDGVFDKRTVFADEIPYPMGGVFYQGSFYATAPPDLLRFTDTDQDGVADKREVILSGWTLNHNAAMLSGPFFGPDGWLYMCDARRGFDITTREGTRLKGKGARIWRCRPDGTGLESVAGGGFDNTIELIFMPSGETIGTMTYFTDPKDGFRDGLMHWVEGGVYPKPFPVIEEDKLKLTGDLMPVMTRLPRVSHSGLMRYRSQVFGKEYTGNLFSAQFNTGRIMRHRIKPAGATYETSEEVFMKSATLDTHPTDVLEDADGSLLVVNTGGWFIAGCPLSVVAKTDVHGGIFRIRKVNAPPVEDPWGKQFDFEAMPLEALTHLLADSRPAVKDRAVEEMIAAGEKAIPVFAGIIDSSPDDEMRLAAVFALYRIGGEAALSVVRSALKDARAEVRTAAARVLGLAKDKSAVDLLIEKLRTDSASVRRQVATALGQIGDTKAVSALIAASQDAADRFEEHSIVYSLITLGAPGPLVDALDHRSGNVRKVALIALDQMEGGHVDKNRLVPFLGSRSKPLQDAGVWVLSHHKSWGDLAVEYLRLTLGRNDLSGTEEASIANLVTAFYDDARIQKFVTLQLKSEAAGIGEKLLLLHIIRMSPGESLPDEWINLLRTLLQDDNPRLQSAVLDLIESRKVMALRDELAQIMQDAEASPAFKLKALSAQMMSASRLNERDFTFLIQHLHPDYDTPVRQLAVRLLNQAELNESQLLTLAKEQLPIADNFLLPGLLTVFEGSKSERVGTALIASLPAASDRMEYLSLQDVQKVIQAFPASVGESAEPLMMRLRERHGKRLGELEKLEKQVNNGDVGEGRKLFFGKALCSSCHAVEGQGSAFGPDLTNIGEIRSAHDILEAILYPSASFAREYESARIITKATSYTGIIKEQLPESILLETGPGSTLRIARNEITRIEADDASFMPPGLDKQLTVAEMADLMAYLTSLPDGMGHLKRKE
jgi:putative membrane-bound dehydrogenase-like protein